MTRHDAGKLFLAAIEIAYPGFIRRGDGKPFVRPHGAGVYEASETTGWYYSNLDNDRFYFGSPEEAAEDCALEMDMDLAEAKTIVGEAQ